MTNETIRVTGYREVAVAMKLGSKETRKECREALKKVGEIVRADAQQKFSSVDAYSAAGYRVSVRARGVEVDQRRKRVTGKRPDYGKLQMRRALLPALNDNQAKVVQELEKALDRVADIIERA